MTKVLLAAALTTGALVAIPVASASAAEFSGACTLSGTATFGPNPLTAAPQAGETYTFTANSGTCSGTMNGTPVTNAPASATATGSGTLGCTVSESVGGTGSITINGQSAGFTISLAGAGTEVAFQLTGNGGGAGGGHASFAQGAGTALPQCASGGVSTLPFTVQATAAGLTG
jgi:hypothetical protein